MSSPNKPRPAPGPIVDHPVVVSPRANRAVARLAGERVEFDEFPRWLSGALGRKPGPLSIPLNGDPLAPIADAAAEVIRSGHPVEGYTVEIISEGIETLAVLIDAHRITGSGGAVAELALQDVSGAIRERRRAAAVGAFHGLVGKSDAMLEVYHRIALYGPTDAPVVVTGETGTGKELVARALHGRSPRAEGPFVPVNCTALTPDLFESELFGHEKGAFTGAYRQHRGRFERADGGTLFLDEIGDMPPMTQAKLLRALEEGVIERVGAEGEQPVDVRVLAATNAALEYAVASGRFRADLYHRLNVFRIHLPPLRERTGDLPLLVDSLLETLNRRYRKSVKRLTPDALRTLEDYPWPGNVRELRNVIERLVVESVGDAIGGRALTRWVAEREYLMPGAWDADSAFGLGRSFVAPPTPGRVYAAPAAAGSDTGPQWRTGDRMGPPPLLLQDDQVEIVSARPGVPAGASPKQELTEESIRRAFHESGGVAARAARMLGVHKSTLYRHMKALGVSRQDLEASK